MANVNIEEVEGGETTTVTSSHSIELDDGVNSTWASVVNLAVYVWNYLTSLTAKTTLVDADQIPLADSAASNAGKKITWANFMAQAAAYTQTLTNKTLTTPIIADMVKTSNPAGQRRLSLTSNLPVTVSDVTAATTIYWTDGNTNLSVAVPSTTVTMFDVFYSYSAGTLSTVNWTNDTTRATDLARDTSGRLVKSGDTDKLYLGTGRTTSVSGQCEDSVTKRFLWNMYNRLERRLFKVESTNTWSYSTATWRSANNSTANRVEFVQGVAENPIIAEVAAAFNANAAGGFMLHGLALDATNTSDTATDGVTFLSTTGVSGQVMPAYARYSKIVTAGYHYLQWVEQGDGVNTNTAYSKSTTLRQSGIVGRVIG